MRLRNIDILRGIVMIVMCIDHARDYTQFHPTDPMDLSETTIVEYLLRILSHYCAPAFILLAGISAQLLGEKKSKKDVSAFLLSRGLILCLLEFTLVNWGWSFNPFYHITYLQVIWATGIAMIVLSFLTRLNEKYIAFFALVILFGHNLLDVIHFESNTIQYYIFSFLEQKNILPIIGSWSVRTTYPVLPVIALMAFGYVLGKIYKKGVYPHSRIVVLRSLSCISFLLFLLCRMILNYGDPHSVEWVESPIYTLRSLFNVTKYPFSLQFVLFTTSIISLFLSFTDSLKVKDSNPLLILGQVPMFFYILHLYILHIIVLIILFIKGINIDLIHNFGGVPANFGVPMWWLIWIVPLTLIILLPMCKWYRTLKFSRKYRWTRYI